MRTRVRGGVLGIAMIVAMAGCGGGPAAPTAPPSPPTTLAGFWAGAVGVSSDDGRSLGVTWSAERIGQGLSGTATLSTLPSAPAQVTFVGTLTATRDNERFRLTYESRPVLLRGSSCAASATGDAHVEDFTLVGNLEIVYASCDGLGLQPPSSTKLQLLKKLN